MKPTPSDQREASKARPYPPICTDVGWSAIKLVATPICAFCAAAAGR
jgi:hypothetical protein